jgi:hypothetical protein
MRPLQRSIHCRSSPTHTHRDTQGLYTSQIDTNTASETQASTSIPRRYRRAHWYLSSRKMKSKKPEPPKTNGPGPHCSSFVTPFPSRCRANPTFRIIQLNPRYRPRRRPRSRLRKMLLFPLRGSPKKTPGWSPPHQYHPCVPHHYTSFPYTPFPPFLSNMCHQFACVQSE